MFVWLNDPDSFVVDVGTADVLLLPFPKAALKSITLGCLASSQTERAVRAALDASWDTSSVELRKARMSADAFVLDYATLPR